MDKPKYISRKAFKKILNNKKAPERVTLDAFDEEAIKGWENSKVSFSQISKLDNRFGRKKSLTSFLIVSTLTITILLIGSIFIMKKQNPTKDSPEKSVQLTYDKTDLVIPKHIDSLSDIPKKQQITAQEVIKTQKELDKIKSPDNTIDIPDIPYPDFTLAPLPASIDQKPKVVSQQKNAKEIYLKSLKAIDYSTYRNKPIIPVEQIILTGVPADHENETSVNMDQQETKTIEVPYMDYLEKTLGYVYKEKWKIALSRFDEILKNYPEDVNAHFYSGWCSYNLGQFDLACTHFSACLQLEFSNFNEEAEWYLAQSRLNNGEKQLAKELFQKIKAQSGFYAKQVEKVLKTWK